MIVGKALYEGRFTVAEAQAVLEGASDEESPDRAGASSANAPT